MTVKKHFESILLNELESLMKNDIQGVRNLRNVLMDLESRLSRDITILKNDQFELSFIKQNKEILFKTTYSGQIIDDDFLSQLRIIDNAKNTFETIINTILVLEETEAAL